MANLWNSGTAGREGKLQLEQVPIEAFWSIVVDPLFIVTPHTPALDISNNQPVIALPLRTQHGYKMTSQ